MVHHGEAGRDRSKGKCSLVFLRGHTKPSRRVIALPRSRAVATACDDGGIRIYRLDTNGQPLHALLGHSTRALGLAELCEDVLVSVGQDGMVKTWRVSTGKQMWAWEIVEKGCTLTQTLDERSFVVATSRGHLIIFAHEGGMKVREVERRRSVHAERINDMDFDAGRGQILTASNDTTAHVWSIKPWVRVGTMRHRERVFCAHFGRNYVVTGGTDEIHLYHRATGFPKYTTMRIGAGVVWSVHAMAGDSLVMTSGDANILYTCVATGRNIAKVETPCNHVLSTSVLPDGRVAYAGSGNKSVGALEMPYEVADAVLAYARRKYAGREDDSGRQRDPRNGMGHHPHRSAREDVRHRKIRGEDILRRNGPATYDDAHRRQRDPRVAPPNGDGARGDPRQRSYDDPSTPPLPRERAPAVERPKQVKVEQQQPSSPPISSARTSSTQLVENGRSDRSGMTEHNVAASDATQRRGAQSESVCDTEETTLKNVEESPRIVRKDSGERNSASSGIVDDLITRTMREWASKGVSAQFVSKLDAPELASMMASYMLRYRETWKSKYEALQKCLHDFFDDNFLTGEDVVYTAAQGAEPQKRLQGAIVEAMQNDKAIGAKMGLINAVERFLETVHKSVPSTNT